MKPTLIKPLVAALALGASVPAALAAISYQYRMPVPGLTVNAVVTPSTPQVPSLVGDGVSTVGGCTSGATGCATWNPTDRTSATTLSADNLVVQLPNRTIAGGIRATVGKTTGKWYWELTIRSTGANNFGSLEPIYSEIGVLPLQAAISERICNNAGLGYAWFTYAWTTNDYRSVKCKDSYSGYVPYGSPVYVNGDVIGVLLDMDSHTLEYSKNGVRQGVAFTGITARAYYPGVTKDANMKNLMVVEANFGQANFQYPVPAGFNAGLW